MSNSHLPLFLTKFSESKLVTFPVDEFCNEHHRIHNLLWIIIYENFHHAIKFNVFIHTCLHLWILLMWCTQNTPNCRHRCYRPTRLHNPHEMIDNICDILLMCPNCSIASNTNRVWPWNKISLTSIEHFVSLAKCLWKKKNHSDIMPTSTCITLMEFLVLRINFPIDSWIGLIFLAIFQVNL